MIGRFIAAIAFGTLLGLVLWGLSHDVEQWLERRHGRRLLEEMADKEQRADLLAVQAHLRAHADAVRDEIEAFDALARQLEEIRNLPVTYPKRELA